ncbi:MAG: TonB-dependent hemoglobin/transferrin/lactoferrin family receptor [Campylobacter sp.]
MKKPLASFALCIALSNTQTSASQNDQQAILDENQTQNSSQIDSNTLQEISVLGNGEPSITQRKVGETKISDKTLAKQQVANERDFVRYQTGVSAVEAGRFGTSGYAIRGVDENRVDIKIDGLRQAQTLSSSAFNELFAGYGNFNNTRNSVEFENVKLATITKGSDGVKSGSGSLGGSVMFETKDARDFLLDKDYYFGFKHGFSTRDESNFKSITTAGRLGWFDLLVVHTDRHGHELKNYFYKENDLTTQKKRESADPYEITKKSTMVKVSFEPLDEHRFSVGYDDSKQKSRGAELSYNFNPTDLINGDPRPDIRRTNDKVRRKAKFISYENFTQTPFWDHFKISYSNQKITTNATNIEGDQREKWITDPNGTKFELRGNTYTLIDKYGNPIKAEYDKNLGYYGGTKLLDSKGNKLDLDDRYGAEEGDTLIDCSKLSGGCKNKKFNVLVEKYNLNTDEKTSRMEERDIKTKNINGKEYGYVEKTPDEVKDQNVATDIKHLLPRPTGYHTVFIWDRDLNTDTNQLNLDFDKEFEVFSTQHSLKYGGGYDKTLKSMVMKDRYGAYNVQWWKDIFVKPGQEKNYFNTNMPRAPKFKDTTYLIPVETTTKHFYIGDEIQAMDWLGFDLGFRRDNIRMTSKYTGYPEVPRGLIAGVFKPLPYDCKPYGTGPGFGYYTPACTKNFQENLEILTRPRTYKGNSYNVGINLDPLDYMRLQFKYANSFRAPTSDEIYMTFKHPQFLLLPAILKPEISKTKEVALTFHKNRSFITFDLFKTKYDNFIELGYVGLRKVEDSVFAYPGYQNVNRDKAKVSGFEISSLLELGEISDKLEGFKAGYKFTHQKGRVYIKEVWEDYDGKHSWKGWRPMNAIQPNTHVFSIGYSAPNDKFGIDLFLTTVAAKKAKDTYNSFWREQVANPRGAKKSNGDLVNKPADIINGKPVTNSQYAWRNKTYNVLDAVARYNPTKNLSFSLGVYNITNTKYATWDNLRSIRARGTTNMIDQKTGQGIGRFYAPKRNFKFNWEIKF